MPKVRFNRQEEMSKVAILGYKHFLYNKWHVGSPVIGLEDVLLETELEELGGCPCDLSFYVSPGVCPQPDPSPVPPQPGPKPDACPSPLLIVFTTTTNSLSHPELLDKEIDKFIINDTISKDGNGFTLSGTVLTFTDGTSFIAGDELKIFLKHG